MYLANFHQIRPQYESSQADTLEWLVNAHTRAEQTMGRNASETALFQKEFREKLHHVGCKPNQIAKRGHVLADFLHLDWDKMSIYQLDQHASGVGLDVRVQIYKEHADSILEQFYKDITLPPDDLIHVTCTGYSSPSCAQKLVSNKGWGPTTVVTHAYHMGCYGAFPAIRMANGFLKTDEKKKRADIVHTEICSLHSNPSLHRPDQLISQSLFADGFIKYSAQPEAEGDHFKIESIREEIIPGSLQTMSWDVVNWGFQMSLAKEVPILIRRALKKYLERLAEGSPWSPENLCRNALFAIHPGGPKIVSHLQEILNLSDGQMEHTNLILSNYGNMSSATLPHVWNAILEDQSVNDQTPIVSLAFGPGLTICGAIMEKRCGGQH